MFRLPALLRRAAIVPALLALVGAAPAPVPKRIVSLNLCADELVIALADPRQIAGLTEWARDPSLSFYAARAGKLPYTHRSAEEVMALRPDVVIGAPFRSKAALGPLKAHGVHMVDLPRADGYAGLKQSVTAVAAAVGHPERGEAMLARLRARLAALGPPPGRGRVAASYQREGYLTGTGTLTDDMLHRAGLTNLAGRLEGGALSQLGLEQIALARPDFLVMDAEAPAQVDRGSAMLRHPLLDAAVPPSHRLFVDKSQLVCPTPGYAEAVASLVRQIRAADAQATR